MRRRLPSLALLVTPPVVFAILGWSRRWNSDDAFINFRIIDNLVEGRGLVYNVGERVEGGTSPLWIGILSLADVISPIRLEWLAVGLGLCLSVAGLVLAQRGARLLWAANHRFVAPVGTALVAVLSPFWDFATSGLETGLTFGWLGLSFYLLCRVATSSAHHSRRWFVLPAIFGLGPLIRPDLGLFTVAFVASLLITSAWQKKWHVTVTAAAVIPVAYQIFRMAYFGILVPNTALAKEAGSPRLGAGLEYAADLVTTYALWFPLGLLIAAVVPTALRHIKTQSRTDIRTPVVLATLVAAIAHVSYVVYVGGDFMHGRLLLPGLFALTMPVAMLPLTKKYAALFAPVLVWAIACGTTLRTQGPIGDIADERAFYVGVAKHDHPVTTDDFEKSSLYAEGLSMRRMAQAGDDAVYDITEAGFREVAPSSNIGRPVVAPGSIGVVGYVAGPDVYVLDRLGLTDVVGARLQVDHSRRIGHQKSLPAEWIVARFVPADSDFRDDISREGVAAARDALNCAPMKAVVQGTSGRLNLREIRENLAGSISRSRLRFPSDPAAAERQLCGG